MAAMLEDLVDKVVQIVTNDGRNIVVRSALAVSPNHLSQRHWPVTRSRCAPRGAQGLLKGFDQTTNIVLTESHERVYST